MPGTKVELTFDPGDLGHINVLDPRSGAYVRVPALDPAYAKGLSLWQHKVIRRYAQRQLNARTDIVALAQAKAEIRALVERDFNRKSNHNRKRHARFLHDHTTVPSVAVEPAHNENADVCKMLPVPVMPAETCQGMSAKTILAPNPAAATADVFVDDETLPIFEADLDLPQLTAGASEAQRWNKPND